MNNCIFCEEGKTKKDNRITESEHFYARLDHFPVSPGHSEIVPKKHIESFFELTPELLLEMYDLLLDTKKIIEQKHSPDGYNIGINEGRAAGQTIDHLHLHIIPRYKGDTPNFVGGIRNIFPEKADYTSKN